MTTKRKLQLQLELIDTELELIELYQKESEWNRTFKREGPTKKRRAQQRTVWTRGWLVERPLYGQYEILLAELNSEDRRGYKNFLRVDNDLFQELVTRVGPAIKKKDTPFRKALDPGLKIAVTLRYLATGNSYLDLQYSFRVASNTIGLFIPQVCEAIIAAYSPEVMPLCVSPEQWKVIADGFLDKWNMPHACGALDGKHVRIKCHRKSGSLYYNYKYYFSKVLFALVDHDYKFIYVEVGANGACSDGQLFKHSELRHMLEDGDLGLPEPEKLPGGQEDVPYFIIGDDAFPLRTWLMKPYSRRHMTREERVFNYRLSRARRIVENAFGILSCKFQCLLGTLCQRNTSNMDSIILCCVMLHNLLRIRYPDHPKVADYEDSQHNVIAGDWRECRQLDDTTRENERCNNRSVAGNTVRDTLAKYFQTRAGSVPWQLQALG